MGEQTITCEGCGSKWAIVGVGNQIVVRLVECPLCAKRDAARFQACGKTVAGHP